MARSSPPSAKVPVLLLKTKSTPGDAYEELFCRELNGYRRAISTGADASYGGLIFTSQRAVEAFAQLVEEEKEVEQGWPHLQDVPIYSVGPATTRALKAVAQESPLHIFGEHTGNGDALAKFILDHYGHWYHSKPAKPPLLFLVGEQRRDIIPKTLMHTGLSKDVRIHVDEVVVYGTGVMESFPQQFANVLQATETRPVRWVVVFSPTGCDSMLRCLGLLDEATGKVRGEDLEKRKTYIATIGPTTRDYLKKTFDFEPDVCAEQPSPDGVLRGIVKYLESHE